MEAIVLAGGQVGLGDLAADSGMAWPWRALLGESCRRTTRREQDGRLTA